jgi:hypothetical protein
VLGGVLAPYCPHPRLVTRRWLAVMTNLLRQWCLQQQCCQGSRADGLSASHVASALAHSGTQPVPKCSTPLRRHATSLNGLGLPQRRMALSCRRRHEGHSTTQCSFAAHSAGAVTAAVHSGTAAVQSAAAQLVTAVQRPQGRDVAAMLFATAGAVAWVKLFDMFARHDILEQVRHADRPYLSGVCTCI